MMGRWSLGFMALSLVLLDQVTKWWAVKNLSLYSGIVVMPHVLDLQRVHNFGAAYGIFEDQRIPLIAVSIGVLIGCWLLRRTLVTSAWSRVGVVILASGAVGNLIDRLWHGFVIDFLNIHIIPVFNVADVCINIGIGCFIVEYFIFRRASTDTV
ncbi:signal peptidase II [bacterium]|nr:signal peptidase II [bacterium]